MQSGSVSDDDELFLPQSRPAPHAVYSSDESNQQYKQHSTTNNYGSYYASSYMQDPESPNRKFSVEIEPEGLLPDDIRLTSHEHPHPVGRILRQGSIVDGLLHEIYDRWHYGRSDSIDSDTLTECSSTSDVFFHTKQEPGGYHSAVEKRHGGTLNKSFLQNQSLSQLERMLTDVQRSVSVMNVRLVKQLKRRDRRQAKLQRNCDIVTAVLQASSLKRQIDTRMKFSIQPQPGESAFHQWRDAMKAVCRLPMGVPPEFRKKVWLGLADHYLFQLKINWEKTVRFAFNERSNPDDEQLGMQIVKDLHRTGCSNFSGDDNDEDRAVLKRLLLAYARWNKRVGYCQGFNVIAALLLNVMDRKEDDSLKVMIYLIDSVLPESYFANNLRALSVDMAVFRDLLRLTYPKLSKHLDRLQLAAQDVRTGACYEPPLTNVFTMQWFLTLFATCLPVNIVLRVWDSILLEGSEVLLRTALTIWGKLAKRIMGATSADEFYSLMGELSSSVMQGFVFDGDTMIKSIYSHGDFPLPHLVELREKYTYNIRPISQPSTSGRKNGKRSVFKNLLNSDEDELDDEDIAAMACMPAQVSSSDISVLGPGVYGTGMEEGIPKGNPEMERMTTDIQSLKLQYERLKQRQRQAHIIISAAASIKKAKPHASRDLGVKIIPPAALVPSIESPVAVNHLFLGKTSTSTRNRLITSGPRISAPPHLGGNTGFLTKQLQAVANAQAVSKSKRMKTGVAIKSSMVASSKDDAEVLGSSKTAEPPSPTSSELKTSAEPVSPTSSELKTLIETTSPSSSELKTSADPVSPSSSELKTSTESPSPTSSELKTSAELPSPTSSELKTSADLLVCRDNETSESGEVTETGDSGHNSVSASSPEQTVSDINLTMTTAFSCHTKKSSTNGSVSCEVSTHIVNEECCILNLHIDQNLISNKADSQESQVSDKDSQKMFNCDNSDNHQNAKSHLSMHKSPVSKKFQKDNSDNQPDEINPESAKMLETCDESLEDSEIEDANSALPKVKLNGEMCHQERAADVSWHEENMIVFEEMRNELESIPRQTSVEDIDKCNLKGTLSETNSIDSETEENVIVPGYDVSSDDQAVEDNGSELLASTDKETSVSKPALSRLQSVPDGVDEVFTSISSPQHDYYVHTTSLIETVPVSATLDVGKAGTEVTGSIIGHKPRRSSMPKGNSTEQDRLDPKFNPTARGHQSVDSVETTCHHSVTEEGTNGQHSLVFSYKPSNHRKTRRFSSPAGTDLTLVPSQNVGGQTTASKTASRPFNPFPVRHFNANRAKTGLKLGLYSESTLEKLRGLKPRTSSS